MTSRLGRHVKLLLICFASVVIAVSAGVPTPATAQGIIGLSPEAPPTYTTREFGINLSTTDIQFQNNDISIGSGDFPMRLTLTRTYSAIGFPFRNLGKIQGDHGYTGFGQGSTHNLLVYFTGQRCDERNGDSSRYIAINAVVFGKSYHFSGGGCNAVGPEIFYQNDDEGAVFRIINPGQSVRTYELKTREGLRVIFSDEAAYRYDIIGGRYGVFVEYPNGDFVNFSYEPSPTRPTLIKPLATVVVRPSTIINSRGYGLSFGYKTRAPYFPSIVYKDSSLITSVTTFKQTVAGRTNQASVYYTYDPSNFVVASFQNAVGGTYRYTYDQGQPTKVFFPRNLSAQPSMSIIYSGGISQVRAPTRSGAGVVSRLADNEYDVDWTVPGSVTDAMGNVTRFQFSDVTQADPISVDVTAPDGGTKSYISIYCDDYPFCQLDPFRNKTPSSFKDELGRNWLYKYDVHGRLLSTTSPEGAVNSLIRDGNGNIIEVRGKAKPGSPESDQVSTTGFTTCTPTNFKYCNSPAYTVDPRGGRWDFQYDPSSGSLAVSLAPADANNVRAVTRYAYTDVAHGPVARPALLEATGIRLLSAKDTCLTSTVSASSVDFSYVCPPGSRSREVYTYALSTTAAPSSSELIGVKPDADGSVASTSLSYDDVGNIISSTDLLGNTAFTTYDALRREVFEIGSDPDGGGPLLRPIVRHVYDGNSNEIRTETGVGSQTNGTDFAILRFVRRTFDLNDKLVRTEDVTP
jgi:YD repeat-containing protein